MVSILSDTTAHLNFALAHPDWIDIYSNITLYNSEIYIAYTYEACYYYSVTEHSSIFFSYKTFSIYRTIFLFSTLLILVYNSKLQSVCLLMTLLYQFLLLTAFLCEHLKNFKIFFCHCLWQYILHSFKRHKSIFFLH